MTTEPAADRRPYTVPTGTPPGARREVLLAVVDVLAPLLDSAWVDEPPAARVDEQAAPSLALVRSLAAEQVQEGRLPRSDEPHLGVDLDPSDQAQRRMFAEIAVLGAGEAYTAGEDLLVAVSDDGEELRVELTPAEWSEVTGRLGEAALTPAP
ncbi:hypothetical protein CLV35_0625 [Motilibacter peucedani]|uniref:Uncharacterized protein n=1 Tax=Motilibacter peucedani TaxID=598650 RepID=A0A420XTN6_9ACTN|nr:hypothetical protein [Motilibacter peucedani]RKS80203.1 hypothetical protein CLV35_0625 [Motilibacter peucedani]